MVATDLHVGVSPDKTVCRDQLKTVNKQDSVDSHTHFSSIQNEKYCVSPHLSLFIVIDQLNFQVRCEKILFSKICVHVKKYHFKALVCF